MAYDHFFIDARLLPVIALATDDLDEPEPFFLTRSFGRGHWKFFVTEEGLLDAEPTHYDPATGALTLPGRFRLVDATGAVHFADIGQAHCFTAHFEQGRLLYVEPGRQEDFQRAEVTCRWQRWEPVPVG